MSTENTAAKNNSGLQTRTVDLVIVGGGPAGLAAAISARESGVEDILILERDKRVGGILNQCIHNGFGLHTFHEELTGPEYAERFAKRVREANINTLTGTMVISISKDKEIVAMNKEDGIIKIKAKAIVLAMGCRERPRGALNIPGYRPAGIYSAGTAQYFVNIEGKMPGREVVILGSGDIGLIMARRMTLEGAKVKVVAEIMPYSGGLKRNIVQCLDDYGIPLKLSHTVVDIKGKERVEGVTLAQVDEKMKPIPGTEEYIPCDTLLLSVGLIPENELSQGIGVDMSPVTSGPVVNESFETSVPGVFACGNVLHVHDLVDFVSQEATAAGKCAAEYISGHAAETQSADESSNAGAIKIVPTNGVRYTVPTYLRKEKCQDMTTVRFRVGAVYKDVEVCIAYDGEVIRTLKKRVMAPGEMEEVKLLAKDFEKYPDVKEIGIFIRPTQK